MKTQPRDWIRSRGLPPKSRPPKQRSLLIMVGYQPGTVVWEGKVARYRAPAHHCNRCTIKQGCTDSDEGRVIERQADSWLESGLRQFHLGISLMLFFLALVISVVEILRQSGAEQASLGTLAAVIGVCCLKLAASVRAGSR